MTLLLFFSLNFAFAVILTTFETLRASNNTLPALLSFSFCIVGSLLVTTYLLGNDWQFLIGVSAIASLWWLARRWLPFWSTIGHLLLVNYALLNVYSIFYGLSFANSKKNHSGLQP